MNLNDLERIGKEATAERWVVDFERLWAQVEPERREPVIDTDYDTDCIDVTSEDLALMATSRNHWQALIDVAKAAQDVRECDAIMKTCGKGTAKWASFMQDKIQAEKRLDAALKKLEEIE